MMKPKTAEKLSWVLIYSGLLLISLGLFLRRSQPLAASLIIALGVADVVAGAVLIWLRSRMKDNA